MSDGTMETSNKKLGPLNRHDDSAKFDKNLPLHPSACLGAVDEGEA